MFPKQGPAYIVSDVLPETTEAIEASVVESFARRLGDSGLEAEVLPRPSGEWPDGALRVDGRRVGLELVEVVDPSHRQKVQGQSWYVAEIDAAFAELGLVEALAGTELQLDDMYMGLPPARSRRAHRLVRLVATKMATNYRETFANSPLNSFQLADFDFPPHRVRLLGCRVAQDGSGHRLRWNGGYQVDSLCLRRAVEKKVGQRYDGRAGHDELWLIAWDSFGYLMHSAKGAARSILDASPHSFDALWTCWLMGAGRAVIEQLWPYDASTCDVDLQREAIIFPASTWL